MAMETPEARLAALGLTLPPPPAPVAAYVPAVRSGSLLCISGQIPIVGGVIQATGHVPDRVSIDEAAACARQCALNGLAIAKAELGELSRIRRVVRVGCFVACGQGFGDHPKVANGASTLLVEALGERGRHARAAVGCPSLPLNVPVEVDFIFEVD